MNNNSQRLMTGFFEGLPLPPLSLASLAYDSPKMHYGPELTKSLFDYEQNRNGG